MKHTRIDSERLFGIGILIGIILVALGIIAGLGFLFVKFLGWTVLIGVILGVIGLFVLGYLWKIGGTELTMRFVQRRKAGKLGTIWNLEQFMTDPMSRLKKNPFADRKYEPFYRRLYNRQLNSPTAIRKEQKSLVGVKTKYM